jgi:acetyltransferase-like isoleucine patch superfamily enzyme
MNGRLGDLLVLGAGGHGQVVAEAAHVQGWRVVGFLDDQIPVGQVVGRWGVVNQNDHTTAAVIVAIGDNAVRGQLQQRTAPGNAPGNAPGITPGSAPAPAPGRVMATVVHPTACVSPSAVLGAGVFVGPHAIINAQAVIADGVIVNSGAIVEHDCRIGAFAHIAPGAALGGGVQVGSHTLVGLGSSLLPGVRIGDRAIIGVGAAVVRDVPAHVTVVGVPARIIKHRNG